jgi:hypothetical protein
MQNMKGDKLTLFIHLAFWAVVLLLPWFMISGNLEQTGFFEGRYYVRVVIGGALFYFSYLWLVPSYYLKGRKPEFFLYAVLAIVLSVVLTDNLGHWLFPDDLLRQRMDMLRDRMASEGMDFHGPPPAMHMMNTAFISMLITGLAMGLRLTEAYNLKEKEHRDLEKEKLTSELSMLKNQISPHFFFNTLNNIYSLTESGSRDASTSILKLSKMMRYVLYDSETGNITLEQELAFMNNYIDLMRLRLSDKVKVSVDFRPHSEQLTIPPMIFIAFIENAFKHGISYKSPSFIDISLKSTETRIEFSCTNSCSPEKGTNSVSGPGIGLENIRKRLNLLYPGRHTLKISEDNESYNVQLIINLK